MDAYAPHGMERAHPLDDIGPGLLDDLQIGGQQQDNEYSQYDDDNGNDGKVGHIKSSLA